jgi:hypothetical protein
VGGGVYIGGVPTLLVTAAGEDTTTVTALSLLAWRERLDRLAFAIPAWLSDGGAELLIDGDPESASPNAAVDPRSFVRMHDLLRDPRTSFAPGSTELAQSREFMCFLATHEAAPFLTLAVDVTRALAAGQDWGDVVESGALAERLERAAKAFDAAY